MCGEQRKETATHTELKLNNAHKSGKQHVRDCRPENVVHGQLHGSGQRSVKFTIPVVSHSNHVTYCVHCNTGLKASPLA